MDRRRTVVPAQAGIHDFVALRTAKYGEEGNAGELIFSAPKFY
jgi:hypothetical protein